MADAIEVCVSSPLLLTAGWAYKYGRNTGWGNGHNVGAPEGDANGGDNAWGVEEVGIGGAEEGDGEADAAGPVPAPVTVGKRALYTTACDCVD